MADLTTRAYTLKLSGDGNWRQSLWQTHVAVNRGAQVWGDWLQTLRGGLPASLADDHPDRRALLALSWLSVESPASLVPESFIVRRDEVVERFHQILRDLHVRDPQGWIDACDPALTARIRDDAVWVNRYAAFAALQSQHPGLTPEWAAETLFGFLGSADEYFALPDSEAAATPEAKDFVQKAGGWLSRNWGAGEKSDASAISVLLARLADIDARRTVGNSGRNALAILLGEIAPEVLPDPDLNKLFKQLKQAIGWKGRSSKGALALEKIRDALSVSDDLWQKTVAKLREESQSQSSKGAATSDRPAWMHDWRAEMESRLQLPYRVQRDLIWEHGVMLDHALRRVSAAHTWIKRAEVERRRFKDDAAKIDTVPTAARDWLEAFREGRTSASGAQGDYIIRKRAIDGWDKIVQAWDGLGLKATRQQRIEAARDVQKNLDENENFGDIQLFAGFGDEDDDDPQPCLSDDDAICVWRRDGKTDANVLKHYVAAREAEHNQQRFKVPAYRHPDPLRNPIYVDFGNSRWAIAYSALDASQIRQKNAEKLAKAKTGKARDKLRQQLEQPVDLRGVTLTVWTGQRVEPLPLRWHGTRLWNDLDLDHFGQSPAASPVSRADRLGRIVAGHDRGSAVDVAEVFQQKDWNGRLQVPRDQLDRLADIVYGKVDGKRVEPDYAKLERMHDDPRAQRQWDRFRWFLTTSAKLHPHGPWLDYVATGLPAGIEYKKGRNGYYLDYAANKGRKGRGRLLLARLPELRVLSLDLGHRYAAACAVWETLWQADLKKEIAQRMIVAGGIGEHDRYVHTEHWAPDGKPRRTIYRRTGPDMWARLERQFLIKLQGEDRPTRRATEDEIQAANQFRAFLGLPYLAEQPRVDDLQKDMVRLARLGLRRLGNAARIAYAITATRKPLSGGRMSEPFTRQQRVEYLQDALVLWQELAASHEYTDETARQLWQDWVADEHRLGGPQPITIDEDGPRSERKKNEATRAPLQSVAEKLADPASDDARQLHHIWNDFWQDRQQQWRIHLRGLRRFILPRKRDLQHAGRTRRNVGGLSVQRLQTIRGLYQALKAFRMRPEPDDLRKNIPTPGDESLARFGRRILDQLEQLREQRIKQLASRVVEAALGAGRMKKTRGRDRKRPEASIDRPCHAVVAENLEHYKPEDSRLRRENRQLMDWAARNVRKYIVEGCQLHGLHFVEVPPAYTSRQDSRTGAPGIRCEDVSGQVLKEAARRAADETQTDGRPADKPRTRFERDVRRWAHAIRHAKDKVHQGKARPRDQVLATLGEQLPRLPHGPALIRLPRNGGEIFVSLNPGSPLANGIQADLNAAANIGLKALTDPDWKGAWWFVLVNPATGEVVKEKIQGSAVWDQQSQVPLPALSDDASRSAAKGKKTGVYAFRSPDSSLDAWTTTRDYWTEIERLIAERLRSKPTQPESPF